MSDGRSRFAHRGTAWEQAVEDQHVAYALAGRCAWIRNQPTRTDRWKGAPMIEEQIRRGRGPPDYTILASGFAPGSDAPWSLTLAVEAKETESIAWPFRNLEEWQARRLDDLARHRVAGFLLVRWAATGEIRLVPWASLAWAWWSWHAKSARRRELHPGDAECIPTTVDYLDAALSVARSG